MITNLLNKISFKKMIAINFDKMIHILNLKTYRKFVYSFNELQMNSVTVSIIIALILRIIQLRRIMFDKVLINNKYQIIN